MTDLIRGASSWLTTESIHAPLPSGFAQNIATFVPGRGRWRESSNSDSTDSAAIKISALGFRGGVPGQGDFGISGDNLRQFQWPNPENYAYYTLRARLDDDLEDFAKIRTFAPVVFADGCYIDKANSNYLYGPSDYDPLGLFGASGNKYIILGMQYRAESSPTGTKTFLFDYHRQEYGRISVYLDGSDLVLAWEKFGAEPFFVSASIPAANPANGVWRGFYFIHDPSDVANYARLVADDGSIATMPISPGFSPYFAPSISDVWTIGKGDEAGVISYADIHVRNLVIRNATLSSESIARDIIDPSAYMRIDLIKDGTTIDCSQSILGSTPTLLKATFPSVPEGTYMMRLRRGSSVSDEKLITIYSQKYSTDTIDISEASSDAEIDSVLMSAHKLWGGASGGVVRDNVYRAGGVLRVRSCGDNYTGPVRGVDRFGNPTEVSKCIGGCWVTRDYYGPGSYRVTAKLPPNVGACSAFWTFHYEEASLGTPLYNQLIADGLVMEGNEEDGYYAVRNHEIDIETPTALEDNQNQEDVSYLNARFNVWRGETDGTYTATPVAHAINIGDGNFHEFRFDWVLSPSPKVDFYIDGQLYKTHTTNIPDIPGRFWVGVWFPRSNVGNRWAGYPANYDEQVMDISRIQIIPHAASIPCVRNIPETYPEDVFRAIKL